jgi:hypothetical protein
MSFLTIAGKALDKPDLDDLTRSLIAREMGRITGRNNHSQDSTKHHTSNSAGKPGGAEIAERQAAERKAFLGDLQKALSL